MQGFTHLANGCAFAGCSWLQLQKRHPNKRKSGDNHGSDRNAMRIGASQPGKGAHGYPPHQQPSPVTSNTTAVEARSETEQTARCDIQISVCTGQCRKDEEDIEGIGQPVQARFLGYSDEGRGCWGVVVSISSISDQAISLKSKTTYEEEGEELKHLSELEE